MNFDVPWIMIGVGLLAVIVMFFVIKAFRMPPGFHQNQEKRAEMRKKLKDAPPP